MEVVRRDVCRLPRRRVHAHVGPLAYVNVPTFLFGLQVVRSTLGMSEKDVKEMSKLFEAIDLEREDSISFSELDCVIKVLATLDGNILEEHVLAVRRDSR